MTQEEKDLLLKDLCARLPYGVIVAYKSLEREGRIKLGYGNIGYIAELGRGQWVHCKPYLRKMSSMTEEEREEFRAVGGVMSHNLQNDTWAISSFTPEAYDWLNSHHFDYRGLIRKGLAIEAHKGMYD